MKDTVSDLELVEQFKGGDQTAFEELYKRYKQKMVHVAFRYTGNKQTSEDIAHETFLEIHQNIERFSGKGSFFSYLYGVTFNKTKQFLDRKTRRKETPLYDDGSDSEDALPASSLESGPQSHDKKELMRLLQLALGQLPEISRKVIILVDIEGLSYEEAAQALGITSPTVGSRLYEARKRLRNLLPLDKMDIFLFSLLRASKEVGSFMWMISENFKLFLGRPSGALLSFDLDGQTNRWQHGRIASLLETNTDFAKEQQSLMKIKMLLEQVEAPELAEDFDVRFERKLATVETETKRTVPAWELSLKRLVPILAVLVAAVSFVLTYPLFQGSPLSVARLQGAVQVLDPKTSTWISFETKTPFREGMKLRTQEKASVDLVLQGQFLMRVKENTEIEIKKLMRSRQKGQFAIKQTSGKTLVGLTDDFEGSRFTTETEFGSAHAYGTLFLVEVLKAPSEFSKTNVVIRGAYAARVMLLEGHVEVTDFENQVVQSLPPQTETILVRDKIEPATPLEIVQEAEIQELRSLPVPGYLKSVPPLLEENLTLLLIEGPGRVDAYLKNPKMASRKDYPKLTETILSAKEKFRQSDPVANPEIYLQGVDEIEEFALKYLDPFGRFKPHLHFFVGATYHNMGRTQEALESFQNVIDFPSKEWQAMAHLARGLIYERTLQDSALAKAEYEAVLKAAPDSPEAQDAASRLKILKS